ncbi:MAG TPA: HAMP domain-containing sensor histidine kinase [Acidimicrobiales bacterium]
MSLRLRVTLLALAALVVGLLAAGVVVPILVERFLTDRLDDQLRGVAPAALRFLDPRLPRYDPNRLRPPNAVPIYVERQAPDGTRDGGNLDGQAATNPPRLPDDLGLVHEQLFTVSGRASGRYRVMVIDSAFDPGATYAIGLPMTEVDATVRRVITIEVVAIGAAVLGVAGLTWWLVGVALRPLRRMEDTAQEIAETGEPGQGQRIEHPATRTEIGQLGATLNTMLDRIDDSFSAQRATEAKLRRFAADASHELRTPLTSIRGYAELYRRGGDDAEQVARSMGRIEAEAGRMSQLVEDLLTLTRLDEGRPLDRAPVDVAELAAKVVDDARVVEDGHPLRLDAPSPVVVDGDANRLTQVLVNLVANAQRHTPAGTEVTVRVGREGTSARIEVVDHGPGLTPEQAEQVFERFYRADPSRSRAQGGSGLGLAIVDAVVRAHGGTTTVDATPGGGATFRVELPVTSADSAGVPSSGPDGAS